MNPQAAVEIFNQLKMCTMAASSEESCSVGFLAVILSLAMLFQWEVSSTLAGLLSQAMSQSKAAQVTRRRRVSGLHQQQRNVSREASANTRCRVKQGHAQRWHMGQSSEAKPPVSRSPSMEVPELRSSMSTQSMHSLESHKSVHQDCETDASSVHELRRPTFQRQESSDEVDVSHIFFAQHHHARRSDKVDPRRAMMIAQRVSRHSCRSLHDSWRSLNDDCGLTDCLPPRANLPLPNSFERCRAPAA